MSSVFHDVARYRFGDFELRPDQGELVRAGQAVPLQPQPLRVLTVLVDRAGDLVRRSELIAEVWGEETHVDFDRGLNFCIKQIRTALGDDASEPAYIRTLPRFGYRFIANVERLPRRAAATDRARRGSSVNRAVAATATALAIVLISLGMTWWFAPVSSEPSAADPRALEEFMRGRHLAETGSSEDAVKSLAHFEQAVAIDPSFARGHLALARAWMRVPGDPAANVSRSRAAVLRALESDAELAEAHVYLAELRRYADWDWEGAGEAYRRAVELERRDASLRHRYAGFLAMMGRHDAAIEQIERAMELDPVSTAIKADAGWFYYQARRFDEAARLCTVTLELDPTNQNALWCLLQSRRLAGRDAEAVAAAGRLAELMDPDAEPAIQDLDAFWRWHLGWLERNPRAASPSTIGLDHLALGDRARALALFEQAYAGHSSCVLSLAEDPQLDPLRGDPRFDDLMVRLGLGG